MITKARLNKVIEVTTKDGRKTNKYLWSLRAKDGNWCFVSSWGDSLPVEEKCYYVLDHAKPEQKEYNGEFEYTTFVFEVYAQKWQYQKSPAEGGKRDPIQETMEDKF